MVFNSDVFLFVFFPCVFLLFWSLQSKRSRYILLTVASYVFYGYWDYRFCFLLFLSSIVSFFTGMIVERQEDQRHKRMWMTASVVFDLAVLGFFKYFNFFLSSLYGLAGHGHAPFLNIVLPVGISFYTFHTISYIVDVTDGKIRPTRDIWEYLTYVSLFSQLVAGPIVRFRQIEQDLEQIDHPPRQDQVARGIGFFVVGLIKKVIIADSVARWIDPLLASYANLTTLGAWMAALGYTLQLYYDFSGYSDMAIGLGHLFGIRIPQNFAAPYQADGIRDFWRRWHISLSSWLRDYLYIRLGGSRKGPMRTHVNLLATMLLGGLWHGASWTFVAWGAYHGLLLAADRTFERATASVSQWIRRGITFVAVVVGWVLFRSTSFSMATVWLKKMVGLDSGTSEVPLQLVLWVLVGLIATNTLPETWDLRFGTRRRWAVVYALCFFGAYLFMNGRKTVFLYYQF